MAAYAKFKQDVSNKKIKAAAENRSPTVKTSNATVDLTGGAEGIGESRRVSLSKTRQEAADVAKVTYNKDGGRKIPYFQPKGEGCKWFYFLCIFFKYM
jgi:hypothetical protein